MPAPDPEPPSVAALRAGDSAAWLAAAPRLHAAALIMARIKFSGSAEDHEDIVQEAMRALWVSLVQRNAWPEIVHFSELLRVFHAIAKNKAFDCVRDDEEAKKLAASDPDDLHPGFSGMTPSPETAVDSMHAWRLAAQLPPPQPEILLSNLHHGESFKSIAQRLSLTKSAVQYQYYQGLKALRQLILPPNSDA
jgi:RNA polymerase sigma factor (sigma-70 family)